MSIPGFFKFGKIVVNQHTKKASLEALAEFSPRAMRVESTQFIKLLVNYGSKINLEYEQSLPTFIGFVPSLKKYQKQYCVHAFSHTKTVHAYAPEVQVEEFDDEPFYSDIPCRWESALAICNPLAESFV